MITIKKLKTIFDSFNKLKVLVIGDVMVDSYLWGEVNRISPEAPVPIVNVNKRYNCLGGVSNVALNLKSLGAEPVICTVIGEDVKGDEFISLLKKFKISHDRIIRSQERTTTTKFRVIGNNVQLLRVDEETDTRLNKTDYQIFLKKIHAILNEKKIDAIVFEDYDKGVIDNDLIGEVVSKANNLNIPIAVDPKHKNFSAYKNITLFKPNLKELKEGLKIDFKENYFQDLPKTIFPFQVKQNIDMMLITLSKDGIYISKKSDLSKKEISEFIPAFVRTISDVSGAGDTVISVASLCLALKLPPVMIATLSNIAGGLVCEKPGVVPIDKEQFLSESIKLLT